MVYKFNIFLKLVDVGYDLFLLGGDFVVILDFFDEGEVL